LSPASIKRATWEHALLRFSLSLVSGELEAAGGLAIVLLQFATTLLMVQWIV
jgi:hypothetical protein